MAKPYKTSLPYRTYVRKLVSNLREYFLLHDWTIVLEYPEDDETGEHEGTLACVHADSAYLNAIIELYPRSLHYFEEEPIEEFVQILMHEIVHIPTGAVTQFAKKSVSEVTQPHFVAMLEQQTQRLTRIIFQSLPKSVYQI